MAKISGGPSAHLPFPSFPFWVLSHQITTLPPTVSGSQGSHMWAVNTGKRSFLERTSKHRGCAYPRDPVTKQQQPSPWDPSRCLEMKWEGRSWSSHIGLWGGDCIVRRAEKQMVEGVWVHMHVGMEEKFLSCFCCCVWGSLSQQPKLYLHSQCIQNSLSESRSCHMIPNLPLKANVTLKILPWLYFWNLLLDSWWEITYKFPNERLLLNEKTPGFLASREEFNPGPEMRLDHSEFLCNKVLLKYKGDIESFWHRHQKGAEKVPPCSSSAGCYIVTSSLLMKERNVLKHRMAPGPSPIRCILG